MSTSVAIYALSNHRRSTVCCHAMFSGVKATGDQPRLYMEHEYVRPAHDVAVFYGYTPRLRKVMADYVDAGKHAVYIDLGYWGREGIQGYHKISVNSRHPTDYFMKKEHDDRRAKALRVELSDWTNDGQHIVLAGMGAKAAEVEGLPPEAWERSVIEQLREITDRPIVYRPKPSWLQAKPIPGTTFSWGGSLPHMGFRTQRLAEVMRGCYAVVTHHSNVAVEAIVGGVPALCWKGLAVPMSSQSLSDINHPFKPAERQQWLNAITYCQWSIAEMAAGLPWRHLKNEGIIP